MRRILWWDPVVPWFLFVATMSGNHGGKPPPEPPLPIAPSAVTMTLIRRSEEFSGVAGCDMPDKGDALCAAHR